MIVANEKTTSRFNRNIKSNSYLVHYRPYQGAKKGKQVASSTKWGLEDNVVLRLMECLNPTVSFDLFIDNYFTSFSFFVLLTHLEVNNIRAKRCVQQKKATQIHYHGGKQQQRKECGHFEQRRAHQAKMLCNLSGC